jgi:hypothetical protein
VVVCLLRAFIDTPNVLSMFMLSLLVVIICVFISESEVLLFVYVSFAVRGLIIKKGLGSQ